MIDVAGPQAKQKYTCSAAGIGHLAKRMNLTTNLSGKGRVCDVWDKQYRTISVLGFAIGELGMAEDGSFEGTQEDLLERVVSMLSVRDVCALASCSRILRDFCSRDRIWLRLFQQRWPSFVQGHPLPKGRLEDGEREQLRPCDHKLAYQGWRVAYTHLHFEMASRARAVIEFVKMCACEESLEVANYLKAMDLLCLSNIGFQDVLANLLSPTLSVLVNLIGLHYSLVHLGIQGEAVNKALISNHVSDRHICLRWWSLGGWSNGFRRRDEMHMKIASLYELTEPQQQFLFKVLERGIVHEVLRVQISADFKSSAWVWRDMHSQR